MIKDKRQIQIKAPPHVIFELIDRMPNKFPIYRFLESKPFFFIRTLLVDGLSSSLKAAKLRRPDDVMKLNLGDTMGPFTLIEFESPTKYWFSLKSLFFDCQTGYSLRLKGRVTELSFDLIAENPNFKERIWWFVFKPFHGLFANKVLHVIKEKTEHNKVHSAEAKKRTAA